MKLPERVLRPVKKIHGGTHIPHLKNTAESETVTMPAPATVCIPLSQHIGKPAKAVVNVGDEVFVGTLLGEADGFVSSPVHSSVSGKILKIADETVSGRKVCCVTVESDGNMTPDPNLKPFEINSAQDIVSAARDCGLVGLGGAGFPTHVKLSPPKDKPIDTLIINAAECEQYITTDYRECLENYNDVVEGVYLLKNALNIENVVICVESNKPQAIIKLYNIATDHRDADNHVKLMELPSSYPQGAEKVLIYSATGRKLPVGALPSDVGCIVMNVTSIATLYRFIKTGMPLTYKRVTVDGTAVKEPKNVIVPIGTRIKDVLEFVGNIDENADKILLGGPMMGNATATLETPIDKRNNALLVMANEKPQPTTACIRCGRCAAACPMGLFPARVEAAHNKGFAEQFGELNVAYCIECGSCAYVCPAKRPLTEVMRIAKQSLRRK